MRSASWSMSRSASVRFDPVSSDCKLRDGHVWASSSREPFAGPPRHSHSNFGS